MSQEVASNLCSLLIDGIKWRIKKRNSEWDAYRAAAAYVILEDVALIVAEYCLGTHMVIPDAVADIKRLAPLVVHKNHSLYVQELNSYDVDLVDFVYKKTCSSNGNDSNITSFDIVTYIEFILTGYNEWIFNETFWLVKDCDVDDDEIYTPCCTHGDARQLAEKLLILLRSRIIGGTK